jgi:hypothetical protein
MIPTSFYYFFMLSCSLIGIVYSKPIKINVPRGQFQSDNLQQHKQVARDYIPAPAFGPRDIPQSSHLERRSCPGHYSFGLGTIDVVHHRSASEDTIYISAVLAISGRDSYKMTKAYGKHGNGNFSADITFENIPLADDEIAALSYLIVNQGHGSQSDVETKLESAAISIAQQAAQLAAQVAAEDVSAELGRVFGFGLGGILGWLVESVGEGIEELITEGCDGYLGAGIHTFTGSGVCSGPIQGTDVNQGTEDQLLMGFIPGVICSAQTSQYDVDYFGR